MSFSAMRVTRIQLISIAIYLTLIASVLPALGQELILSGHENHSLGNCTLQVEDIDIQAGEVWLVVSGRTGLLHSRILGLNDTLRWDNQTLTVTRIYAGGGSDLVFIRINGSSGSV